MHSLRVTIRQQPQASALTTNPALLVAAENKLDRRVGEAVDEDGAGLQPAADGLGMGDVGAPDAGSQTRSGRVGARDDVLFG